LTAESWVSVAVCIGLAAATCGILAVRRSLAAMTAQNRTLHWMAAASLTAAALEAARTAIDPAVYAPHMSYLAGCVSFAPLISTLGARKPQQTAWHFIVATLLVVLALPCLQSPILRPSQPLEIHAAMGWFLLVLTGVGLANWLATGRWLSGLLSAAAQWLWLGRWLPGPFPDWTAEPGPWPLVVHCAGVVGFCLARRPFSAESSGWNDVWRDFRDLFGAVWALRLQERFNSAARLADWPIHLQWSGFVQRNTEKRIDVAALERPLADAVETSLNALLRRFVSTEWIEARTRLRSGPAEAFRHAGRTAAVPEPAPAAPAAPSHDPTLPGNPLR
jgi:hypothetical protein